MRYVILETDWTILTLSRVLTEQNMLLTRTERPSELMDYVLTLDADAVILHADALMQADLTLPALRAAAPTMAIALIERGGSAGTRAKWFDRGADVVADDKVCPRELSARLQAAARRMRGLATSRLRVGNLSIDLNRRQADVCGVALHLSPKIYEMLERMALQPGRLVTRDALLSHIYALEDEPDKRIFDVYLCTLRERLNACDTDVAIETVRGQGFRLVPVRRIRESQAA